MIAVRNDLVADINAVVDTLARLRKSLVSVADIGARLSWSPDRFEDAVAEAEASGRLQTWENPHDGGMLAVLTPVEAETRGLRLCEAGSRWIPVRGKDPTISRRIKQRVNVVNESSLCDRDGGFLELTDLADDEAITPLDIMVQREEAQEKYLEDLRHAEKYRIKDKPLPPPTRGVVDGGVPWPPKGVKVEDATIQDIPIRVTRMMVETCPACGGTEADRLVTNHLCLICVGSWPSDLAKLRSRKKKAKSKESTEAENSYPVGHIKFIPRTRGARRKAVLV